MHLKVVLPHQLFLEQEGVKRIVLESRQGSLGLLPHRLDCVTPLVPGILIYEPEQGGEQYVALGVGILTKVGARVTIAVRNAFAGDDLHSLRQTVKTQLARGDEQERSIRTALAKLESDFVRRFWELKRYD